MKNIRPRHLFISLLAFFFLASFTGPLQKLIVFTEEKINSNNQVLLIPGSTGIPSTSIESLKSSSIDSDRSSSANNIATSISTIDSVSKNTVIDDSRIGQGISSIKPLPVKPLAISVDKKIPLGELLGLEEKEYYKYDSVAQTFRKIESNEKNMGFDPVRFKLRASKDSVTIGEEFEIKIIAEFLDVNPRLIFQFEGSNEFALKMLMAMGFVQTGGTYYDFIQGKVDKDNPRQEFSLKGFFESQNTENCFSLLRSHKDAGVNDVWIKKETVCVSSATINFVENKSSARILAAPKPRMNSTQTSVRCPDQTEFQMTLSNCLVSDNIRLTTQIDGTGGSQLTSKGVTIYNYELDDNDHIVYEHRSINNSVMKELVSHSISSDNILSLTFRIQHTSCPCKPTSSVKRYYYAKCANEESDHRLTTLTDYPETPATPTIAAPPSVVQGTPFTLEATCTSGNVVWENEANASSSRTIQTNGAAIGNHPYKAKCRTSKCESETVEKIVQVTAPCPSQTKPTITYTTLMATGAPGTTPTTSLTVKTGSVNGCPGGTPKWSYNGLTDVTVAVPVGDYTVTCELPSGCESAPSEPVTVYDCSIRPAKPDILGINPTEISNKVVTLATSATGCPGVYEWYKDGQSTAIGTTSTSTGNQNFYQLIGIGPGIYKVRCIADNGCPSPFSDEREVKHPTCNKPTPVISDPVATSSGFQLNASGSCSNTSEGVTTTGTFYWYKNNASYPFDSVTSITVDPGTYQVRCVVPNTTCSSSISATVTIGDCQIATAPPSIETPNGRTVIGNETKLLQVTGSCSTNGISGFFEWYKNGGFYSNGENTIDGRNFIYGGKGTYTIRCTVKVGNQYCSSVFSNPVDIGTPPPCGNNVYAWSNATTAPCAVSVGDALELHGGLENGVQADEVEWWFNGVRISNSGEFRKEHAQTGDSGNYLLRIKKNDNWCETTLNVNICPCNFSVGIVYNIVDANSNPIIVLNAVITSTNNTCVDCDYTWNVPSIGLIITKSPVLRIPSTTSTRGNYTLSVTRGECTDTANRLIHEKATPNYNGNIINAFCDTVEGKVNDVNNDGFQFPDLTMEIKKITSGGDVSMPNVTIPVTHFNTFSTNWMYKDGNTYKVQVKLPSIPVGTNSGTYIEPYISAPAIIRCCSLTLPTDVALQPKVTCDPVTKKAKYLVYISGVTNSDTIKYRLLKKSYNASHLAEYVNVAPDWTTILPGSGNIGFVQFTDLERGMYKCEILQGSNPDFMGCKVITNFEVDCDPVPPCGPTPLITVVPDGIIPEGAGILPTLYAEPMTTKSNTPTGLGKVAVLNGSNSIKLKLGLDITAQNFGFEAWINVDKNKSTTVGYIGNGEKHRFLLNFWANPNTSFASQLSVGSNGLTLIETISIQNSRRVAFAYESIISGWNHIAIFYRNRVPELYLNGVFLGKANKSIFAIYEEMVPPVSYINPLKIFDGSVGTDEEKGYSGMIDEIRLWELTLPGTDPASTAAAITANMARRNYTPLYVDPPVDGYWAFEGTNPASIVGSTSNNNAVKFEGVVPIVPVPTDDDKLPIKQDYKWFLNGVEVGAGSFYTMAANEVKANSQTYVLRYTGQNGTTCETSKTIEIGKCVSITPLTSQFVCEGTSVVLTASSTIASGFNWYKAGKTDPIATNVNSYTVSGSVEADGVYYAKASGCSTGSNESEHIVVKHAPVSRIVAEADPNPAQAGGTVTFKANITGDNANQPTYAWTGPNSFTSTLASPVLTSVTKSAREGTYKITITELTNNLSCTSTATVKLLINNCDFSAGAEASCSANLGTITVSISGNTAGRTVEYSLDNTTWQTSNVFSSLLSGKYKVYTRSRVTGAPVDQSSADICYANVQEVSVSCGTTCTVLKKLNYERWDGISGAEISAFDYTDLVNNYFTKPKTASGFAPDMESAEKMFEIHNITTHNFIARMTGSICPPVTGTYKFYVAADNSARLYLKTGATLQEIVPVPNQPNNHDTEYASGNISLTAGVKYQIEVHHKQDSSTSFIKVKWQLGSGPKQLISAEYLDPASSSPGTSCPQFELVTNPAFNLDLNATPFKIVEGTAIKALATAQGGNTSDFKWEDMQAGAALFNDPQATSGLSVKNTNSGVPLYIRPSKTSPTVAYEDKVYKVSYTSSNSLTCYKEIKLRVISMTCDCDGGNCDNLTVQNPGIIKDFTSEKNYVAETLYLDESATSGVQTVTYIDGLGRPSQKVSIQAGPDKQDLVQAIAYDEFGRSPKAYLAYPVTGNIGKFVGSAASGSTGWYGGKKGSSESYSLTDFEASPLNRPANQRGTGYNILNGNTAIKYGTNTGSDIKMFTVNGTSVTVTNYPAGSLFKTTTTESATNTETLITNEYKDTEGRVICKDVGGYKTYNVYNDLGQLVCVIPPKATIGSSFTLFDASAFNELIFQYRYNDRGLLIEKKVPGAAAVLMEYSEVNDLLLSLKEERNITEGTPNPVKQETTYIYDNLNRLTETKIGGVSVRKTYYDDYYQINQENNKIRAESSEKPDGMEWDDNVETRNLKGLVVGSWEAIYKADGSISGGMPTTLYYDKRYRVIQTVQKNHIGTDNKNFTTSMLDFTGRSLATYQSVTAYGRIVTKTKTGYDYGGRATGICQKIDKDDYSEKWEPLATYTYNEIGEMVQKVLGCRIQVVDYKYNIRGWLEKINDPGNLKVSATKEFDFFGMSLAYTGDGNIVGQTYQTAMTKAQYTTGGLFTDVYDLELNPTFAPIFAYEYKYDAFKRLKRADLKRGGSSVFTLGDPTNTDDGVTYDKNGNILTLKRKLSLNTSPIDNLTYTYKADNPNRLESISDGATEVNGNKYAVASGYTYYSDGSLKTESGRGITDDIKYNPLQLIRSMKAGSTTYQYTYSASGQKLTMTDGTKTYNYIGNAVYLKDGTETKLEFVGNQEGRWLPNVQLKAYNANKTVVTSQPNANFGRYEYQLNDHLGNLRASCRCLEKPGATAVEQAYLPVVTQENHYDPWGIAIEKEVVADKDKLPSFELQDRFTFNGKESQGSLGLLDYGARMYDPTIGRWRVIDPLVDIAKSFSPYVYGNNNPLRFIDPSGMASEDFTYSDGYSTLSARNSTGSVSYSGAYQNNGQEGCPPNCGGYGGGDSSTPYKALDQLKPASQQNATVSPSKTDNYSDYEKAAQLGVNIAWTVEGGINLIKGGVSFLKSGIRLIKLLKFTSQEIKIINEANSIMKSKKLLTETFNSGIGTELKIAGRTIIVEPQAPMSGMTLFEENAFVIGKEAFSNSSELGKTILHELHRLHTSILRGKTGTQGLVSKETAAAANFAEKAAGYIK